MTLTLTLNPTMSMNRKSGARWRAAGVLALVLSLPIPAVADGTGPAGPSTPAAPGDLVAVAASARQFRTLLAAAEAAGLVDALRGPGPLTVFAPNDAAFAKLPAGTLEGLLKDPERLAGILRYHVVSGAVRARDVRTGWVDTLQGQALRVEASGGSVTVDGARVIAADVEARNGVIHVIDAVVLPRPDLVTVAREAKSFGTLLRAVEAAGLADTLRAKGPFTVFAPRDAAFAALPAGALDALLADPAKLASVLTYHVVPGRLLSSDLDASGGDVTTRVKTVQGGELVLTKTRDGRVLVNGSPVAAADVRAGNGVVHVLDAVLMP